MLAVIAILGVLAALTLPAIKEMGKANAAVSATRQLLDGVARARQLAIANHTTVYMVFVPANFWTNSPAWLGGLASAQKTAATNLCNSQLAGFGFVAWGAVGDQPGRHAWHYLDAWRTLPENAFIAAWKFVPRTTTNLITDASSGVNYRIQGFDMVKVPFPTQDSVSNSMPCLAFNYLGQLTTQAAAPIPLTQDEYIPLARGTVAAATDPATKTPLFSPPDVTETPPGNSTSSAYTLVDIDPLTGRATLRFQQVQ